MQRKVRRVQESKPSRYDILVPGEVGSSAMDVLASSGTGTLLQIL
jgi:hypothetical protein